MLTELGSPPLRRDWVLPKTKQGQQQDLKPKKWSKVVSHCRNAPEDATHRGRRGRSSPRSCWTRWDHGYGVCLYSLVALERPFSSELRNWTRWLGREAERLVVTSNEIYWTGNLGNKVEEKEGDISRDAN